jgi:3-hydroxyacyl-[acyl-carrier-protein] dehydratase
VAGREPIIDLSRVDFDHVLATIEDIRRYNPQRHEMEQLTAIVYEDPETVTCAGYKDLTADEFWVRGHMPGRPLMPGVIMCEAAAQIASYYVQKLDLLGAKMLGFGGLEDVHFRGIVRPGDRLVVAIRFLKIRPGRMVTCRFQAFVKEQMVCDGIIKGIPLPDEFVADGK